MKKKSDPLWWATVQNAQAARPVSLPASPFITVRAITLENSGNRNGSRNSKTVSYKI